MRFSESDSSDETATSISDVTESSLSGHTDKESDVDFREDRFRVDRRKLEQMLQGEFHVSKGKTVQDFFHKIMEDTQTKISWPSKLKVGAKSKKDPHIKIIGDPENVQMAKEKVLEILDTKKNKVTLKMDVSFTDHSHIIGKGGRSIQQVMEDTGCHIHFPDSNRNSSGEKSNQVSIAGLPSGVEKARCQIRELLPLVLMFDIPHNGGFLQPVTDVSSPAIQFMQQKHGFTVAFRPKHNAITVVVRGSRKLFLQQKQGVQQLMDYLTGSPGALLPVSLSTEVMPQHHAFVMGKGNCNIVNISRETGATVTFPNTTTHMSNLVTSNAFQVGNLQQAGLSSSKSTVLITGHIDGVCVAWQQLMGCLPLVLMFDLREGQELDQAQVTRLMNHSEVSIVIRPKPKQRTKCLLVRGAERDSRLLFEIRRQLLGVDPSFDTLPICCEKHAKCSSKTVINSNLLSPTTNSNGSHYNNQINFTNSFHLHHPLNSQNLHATLPYQLTGSSSDLSGLCGGQGNYPLLPWLLQQLSGCQQSPLYSALLKVGMSDPTGSSLLNMSVKDFISGPAFSDKASNCSQPSPMSSPDESPCVSPVFMTNNKGNVLRSSYESVDNLLGGKDVFSCTKTWKSSLGLASEGIVNSNKTYSDFPERPLRNASSSEHLHALQKVLPAQSTQSRTPVFSPLQQNTVLHAPNVQRQGRPLVAASANCSVKDEMSGTAGLQNQSVVNGAGSIGCERKISPALADYNAKKLQAVQAVQKQVTSGARIPTDAWAGFGFSKTVPEHLLRNKLQESGVLSTNRVDSILESPVGTWQDELYNQESPVQDYLLEKNGFNSNVVDSAISSFSSSNYFDGNLLPKDLTKDITDLPHLLSVLGLDKYREVFVQQQVDLSTFLTLNDRNLQELSIPSFGRRKMLKAISELKEPPFQPAPGAERRAFYCRQQQQQQQSCFSASLSRDW